MGLYNMDRVTDETLAEAATILTPHSSSSQTLKVCTMKSRGCRVVYGLSSKLAFCALV